MHDSLRMRIIHIARNNTNGVQAAHITALDCLHWPLIQIVWWFLSCPCCIQSDDMTSSSGAPQQRCLHSTHCQNNSKSNAITVFTENSRGNWYTDYLGPRQGKMDDSDISDIYEQATAMCDEWTNQLLLECVNVSNMSLSPMSYLIHEMWHSKWCWCSDVTLSVLSFLYIYVRNNKTMSHNCLYLYSDKPAPVGLSYGIKNWIN